MELTPSMGKVTMGKKAVTGTEIASDAHQVAIHSPTPATRHASVGMAVWVPSNIIITANMRGPSIRPTS